MKRTKRLLSVFLTLCLLLGMLPTTARAASALSITQQPTAENGYKVTATYMNQLMDQGFQWYKKVDTATTYTLVEKNPKADELAVDAVYVGSYTNGHWEDGTGIFVSFLSSPGDEITVTVSGGEAPEGTLDETDITFTAGSSDVYTATSTGGMLSIRIESSEATVTATITVKRCWTPVAGQTSASLTASESGTYYCAVSKDGEGAITGTVQVVGSHSDHPVCGTACSHGGAHGNVTWQKLTRSDFSNRTNGVTYSSDTYTLAAGSYYLAEDIPINAVLRVTTGTTVKLCLNGHKISNNYNAPNSFLNVYGSLTLCSCVAGGDVERQDI